MPILQPAIRRGRREIKDADAYTPSVANATARIDAALDAFDKFAGLIGAEPQKANTFLRNIANVIEIRTSYMGDGCGRRCQLVAMVLELPDDRVGSIPTPAAQTGAIRPDEEPVLKTGGRQRDL